MYSMSFKNWLNEVTTIKHDESDDNHYDKMMHSKFKMLTDQNRLSKFGHIKNIELLSAMYPRGISVYFVQNNIPIGFSIVQKDNWPEGPDKITLIYINKEYRNQGIGGLFHEFLLEKGFTLKPDTLQTIAMQGLWKKLSLKYDKGDGNLSK